MISATLPILIAAIALLVGLQPGSAKAQRALPENATPSVSGNYWTCDEGFQDIDDVCVAVELPANAHLSPWAHRRGWDCDFGYRMSAAGCGEVFVPANAYLKASGDSWACNRGFRTHGDDPVSCIAIDVPPNAFLNANGDGIDCARGFMPSAGECEQIMVPEHGYLSDRGYGKGWICERGFQAVRGSCLPLEIPANAFAVHNMGSKDWQCERGFRSDGQSCVAVAMPENAHLDYSGSEWSCNPPLRRQANRCIE